MKNSSLIKEAEADLLNKWVFEAVGGNLRYDLLWKGSRDGFTASAFHSKCNGKGATLTVIMSEHQKLFGGYTSESWGFWRQQLGFEVRSDRICILVGS